MLRLPAFTLRTPDTVEEAARILAGEGPDARVVAGGTDLWPNMKRRHQTASTVVSLMGIDELRGLTVNGEVRLGACEILEDVARNSAIRERYPALARAVESISSPPLRWMGTIGGNVCVDTRCTYYNQTEEWRRSIGYCMKAEGDICWVATSSPKCLAHSASDSAPMLQALEASIGLRSVDGERRIPIAELYRNDGIDYLGKKPGEIVTSISIPAESDASRCRSAFWKLRRRGSIDFAVLSVAAAVWLDGHGVVEKARIVLGAVRSEPSEAEAAAQVLVGRRLDEDAIQEAANVVRKAATPFDNTDFQAQWRGLMVTRYTEAALREIAGLPQDRLTPNHPIG